MLMTMPLRKSYFTEKEAVILKYDDMQASAFLYSTGVCGLRISNRHGYVEMLPFQGQQVWRVNFLSHDLVMKTVFDEPRPTTEFLSTYGAFLLHCGLTAVGVPTEQDTHPLHGELPNAAYDEAWLESGENKKGKYIALCGKYRYSVGFETDYMFCPQARLYNDASTIELSVEIKNLRSTPLEYSYLCHINFLPVDGSRLIASTKFDKEHIYMHRTVPSSLSAEKADKLNRYFDALEKDPALQNTIDSTSQAYDPEIVFTMNFIADIDGYAHSMQCLPDGYAHYVKHSPCELPLGLRWIARTEDEDAIGFVLPSTAEHTGYIDTKRKGLLRYIEPKGTKSFTMEVGIIPPEKAKSVSKLIEDTVK